MFEGACAHFRTGSFADGCGPGGRDRRAGRRRAAIIPTSTCGPQAVTVRLSTHEVMGLTERDVELARQISAAARDLGVPADPSAVQTVQIAIDALVSTDVMPFWRAVLGYEQVGDEDLVDPRRPRPGDLVPADGRSRDRSATASTSTSRCRTTRPRRGSRPAWPRAAASCSTGTRPRGGPWPTRRATRSTSPPGGGGSSPFSRAGRAPGRASEPGP